MSICVAVSVPDGIALCADTRTAWFSYQDSIKQRHSHRYILLEQPLTIPIGWTSLGRKLFCFTAGKTPFGICTSGAALIGRKTIRTVIAAAQAGYDGEPLFDQVRDHILHKVREEMCRALGVSETGLKDCDYSDLDLMITGFDEGDVSKPRIEKHTVFSGVRREDGTRDDSGICRTFTNRDENGEYAFTACCIGETSYTDHLLSHDAEKIPGLTDNLILLSLADARDFCEFLVEFTCDYQRFSAMVPTCGKPILSAILTPETYEEFGGRENG